MVALVTGPSWLIEAGAQGPGSTLISLVRRGFMPRPDAEISFYENEKDKVLVSGFTPIVTVPPCSSCPNSTSSVRRSRTSF